MSKFIGGHPVVDGVIPPGFGTGYVPRDYKAYPLGGLTFAKSAPIITALSDAEIIEAAKDKTANKTWLTDHFDRLNIPVKNQLNSNYCWAHGATRSCEACYVMSGGQHVPLAAFDIGALVKGGWNQGGSGIEAIQRIAQDGICAESLHKPMDFSPHRTAEQEASAQLHKVEAYDDLDPSDLRLIATYAINNICTTVGIPAMGHEMAVTFVVIEGDTWHLGVDNSWGTSDGNNGRRVLTGIYTRLDEAGAVRLMTPAQT